MKNIRKYSYLVKDYSRFEEAGSTEAITMKKPDVQRRSWLI
jgi:hypothetical protein